MRFLPIFLFVILLIRDIRKSALSYVETNTINYKEIFALVIMLIGIEITFYYTLA